MNKEELKNLDNLALRKKLFETYNKKKEAINCIIIGGGSFAIISPIYLSNLNIANIKTTKEIIPLCFMSLIELGLVVLPTKGIKDLITSNKNIKLIKKEINNTNEESKKNKKIITIPLESESLKKKNEKLKKLKKEINELYCKDKINKKEKGISYKKS